MSEKLKNIVALFIAFLIVGFLFFAVMHWLFGWEWKNAMNVAISGTLGGSLGPYLWKYFKKRKKTM